MNRDDAIKELTHELRVWECECKSGHPMKDALKMAIEALKDRPQGEWEFDEDEGEYCSECKRLAEIDTITGEWILSRYCGYCGAYMVNHSTVYER